MRRVYVLFLLSALFLLGLSTQMNAQISKGGIPASFTDQTISTTIDVIDVPAIDVNAAIQQDATRPGPMWAGRSIPVDYNMSNSGTWSVLADGRRIWRLKLTSSGAKGLSIVYNDFYIPKGGKLFLYNETKNQVIGAFTSDNNPATGVYSTELIQGQTVTLEYIEPGKTKFKTIPGQFDGSINGDKLNNSADLLNSDKPSISISELVYLYRESSLVEKYNTAKTTGFGSSLACEVNVNCTEGTNWQNEKRGVAEMWIKEGASWGWCTGSLVNTTNNSGTPYFLTADHCHGMGTTFASAADMLVWEFYFKYEAPSCTNPGADPFVNTYTIIGCVLKAASPISGGSDFCLVLLNTAPPQTYNPYYNGWDRTNVAATSGVGIHHPAGDIKKISTFTSTLTTGTWNDGTYVGASGAHWGGNFISTGTGKWGQTEGGSSGSPIFNQNKRQVGTLSGGTAANCTSGSSFDYGKFWYHWDQTAGGTTTQLKTWLDPVNALSTFVNGYDPFAGFPDFYATPTIIYEGGTVNYTDITNGATTWSWQFEGGSPATSSVQNPANITYAQQGTYRVSLTTSTPTAGTQTQEKVGYITVLPGIPNTQIWCDDFTTASNWSIINHSGAANQVWAITTAAPVGSFSATNPGKVTSTSGGNYALFDSDGLTTASVEQWSSISSNVGVSCTNYEAVILKFQEAYTKFYDSTLVYVSTDNFVTSTRYVVNSTIANNGNSGNPFICALDITGAAAGQTNVKVRFTFRSTPSNMGTSAGWGYAWSIDDVCMEGVLPGHSLPQPDFTASTSRKVSPGQSVSYTDQSTYATSWLWTFEGGTPSTSSAQNPTNIVYNTQGYYAVTLAATNSNGTISISKTNYVHVFYDCSYDSNVQPGDGITYFGAPGALTGFVPGTNTEFATYAYADKYTIGNLTGKVKSLAVGVGAVDIVGGTTNVTFTVWDNNAGSPGAVLTSKVVPIKSLIPGQLNYIDFAPVSVGSTFFAGFQLTNAVGMDTLACYLAQGGYGRTNTAYFNNGTTWATYESKYAVNGSLYIRPEFCFTKPVTSVPDADFFASQTDIALGNTISFTDQSTGGSVPTSWSWTLTGATPNTSSVQNPPTETYAAAGLYDVTLNSTNANGTDPETKVGYIHVAATNTIVNWTFPSTSANATADAGGIAANAAKVITNWANPVTTITYATTGAGGGTDKCASTTAWDAANTNGSVAWSVKFTTAGYTNIKMSSKQSAPTTSSPRDFSVYYNVNGTGYNLLADVHAMTTTASWAQGVLSNIQLPSECDNQTEIELAWYKTSDVSANGGAVTAAATSLIDDIIVTGQPCTNMPVAAGTITGSATVCQGQQGVAYSVAAINGATIYNWVLPAGATIASGIYTRNITVNFAQNQTAGNITVQGENMCGVGTISANYAVAINLVPIVPGPITGSQVVANGQTAVAYSVPNIAGATSYTWTLPGFATMASGSGTRSITVDIACPGLTDNFTVHANNACGAGPESYAYSVVAVCATPVADFVANTTTVVAGGSVNFTDLSTNNPTSWSWTFNGGTPGTSAVKNPAGIVYSTAGVYDVTLTATNALGNNAVTKTGYITVTSPPVAIVTWNFPNTSANATADPVSIAANSAKTITVGGGATAATFATTGASGGTDMCASAAGWVSGMNVKYWQVDFVTTGYASLTLSSKMTGPNTSSPKDFKVQYKIGAAGTWTDVPNTTLVLAQSSWTTATANLSNVALPVECNNQASVFLRWLMTSNAGIAAATVTNAARTCLIDDIIVKGVLTSSAPVANFSATPTSVCAGSTVAFADASTNTPTSWSWTFTGGTPSVSTSQNPTITYSTPGTYAVALTATNSSGNNTKTTASYITVNAIPTIASTTPLSRCGTGTVVLGATASAGTVNWYSALSGGTAMATGTSYTTSSIAVTTTYYVDATSNGCTTATRTAVVATVNSIPTISATTPASNCGTGTITLGATASAGTVNWYSVSTGGTATATGTSYTTPSISATTSYYVDATNGGCTTTTRTVVVATVKAIPTISATTPASRCDAGTVTLSATASAGTVNWYTVSTGGTATATGTSFTTSSIAVTTTYYVDATSNGCTTATRTAVVATVNATPTISATTPASRCGTGTVVLGATASAGTVNWYTTSTGGTATSTGTSYTTPSLSATTSYFVNATNGGCTTATRTAIIATVNTIPTVTATPSSQVICSGSTTNIALTSGVSGTTYAWTVSPTGVAGTTANSGTSIAQTLTVSGIVSGTATYSVTPTANSCAGTAINVVVTVNPLPVAAGTITGAASVCNNQTGVTYSVSAITNATGYTWTVPSGATITAGNNSNSITVSFSALATSGNVTVLGTNTCGNGSVSANFAVTVNPTPTANAGLDQTICNGQSASLTATSGTSYAWSNGAVLATTSVSPTTSTTYVVTVTTNGCSATDAVLVTVNSLPTANAGIDQSICNGQSATITATGGTSYVWSGGATTASTTVSPASITTYTVTVTDINGCTATDAILINVNSLPIANAGADENICGGLSATLTATGGSTYLWSNGASTATTTVTPTITTTYIVTVTGANGCTATDAIVVNVITGLTASAGTNATIPWNTTTTLSGSATGGSGNYTYSWTPAVSLTNAVIQNPTTVALLATTIFTLSVTDVSTTCASTANVTISVSGGTLTAITTATPSVICAGSSSELSVVASGGSGNYTYSWSSIPAGFTSSVSNPVVSPTVSTAYIVTVNDGSTTITSTASLTVNALPQANAGADNGVCIGSNANLIATGGVSYVWNTGDATSSISVTPATTTTYTVTVSDVNGCSASDAVVITVNTLPVANAGVDQTICEGENATLTATGGFSYAWSSGDNTAIAIVTPVGTATFTVTVTNANGCIATDAITVNVNLHPIADAGNTQTICSGTNANLIATGGVAYSWSDGAQTASTAVSPIETTTYTVTVTGANACTSTASVVVNVNSLPDAAGNITGVSNVCASQTGVAYTVSAINNAISYNWLLPFGATIASSTGNTIFVDYAITSGSGNVSVSGANACGSGVSSADFAVTVNSLPNANAGNDQSICSGTSTILVATGGVLYTWSNGGSSASETVIPLNSTTYTVTVTDANNCSALDAVIVTVNESPIVNSGINQTITYGTSTTLSGSATGGSGNYSYSWTPTTDLVSANVQTPITNSLTVSTVFTLSVSDNVTGCMSASDVTVFVTGGPLTATVVSASTTICSGATVQLGVLPSGGTGNYTYSWSSNPAGFTSNVSNPTVTPTATTSYTVTVSDGNSSVNETSTVIVNANPLADAGIDQTINNGSSATLTATGGVGFMWSTGASTASITVSPVLTTTYTVTVTNSSGCSAIDAVVVNVNSSIIVDISSTNVTCFGGNDGIANANVTGGTAPYSYVWTPSGSTTAINNFPAGVYSVVVTDLYGAQGTSLVAITEPSAIIVTYLTTNATSGNNGAIDLSVTGGTPPYVYTWANGPTTQDLTGIAGGTYNVTVTDMNGCLATQSIVVDATICNMTVIINSTNLTCFGSANGSADAVVLGASLPAVYNWSNGAITANISNLMAGTYSVTATDVNACTATASVTINEPIAIVAIATATSATCGNADGSVSLTVTGGAASYVFLWSNGATTQNLANVVAGTYAVTVTDASGCSSIASAIINNAGAPTVVFNIQNATCYGTCDGNVFAMVSGGTSPYTYSWAYDNHNSAFATSLCAGSYDLSVTDSHACVTIVTAVVTSATQIVVSSINTPATCGNTDGTVALSVNGGASPYTYNWANGATTSSISGLAAGSYIVTVQDASNCSAVYTAVIASTGGPTITINASDASCFNNCNGAAFASVSAGTMPYIYNWSNSQTGAFATNLCHGTYTLTVQDAAGCSSNSTVVIGSPAEIIATSVSIDETSAGTQDGSVTLTVSGGSGSFTYAWSANAGGQITANATNLSAGIYTVTITDGSCTVVLTDTVGVGTAIVAISNDIVSVFPNPTTGIVNITTNSIIERIELTDLVGRSLFTVNDKQGDVQIDLRKLVSGVYLLNVKTQNRNYMQRIILKD